MSQSLKLEEEEFHLGRDHLLSPLPSFPHLLDLTGETHPHPPAFLGLADTNKQESVTLEERPVQRAHPMASATVVA